MWDLTVLRFANSQRLAPVVLPKLELARKAMREGDIERVKIILTEILVFLEDGPSPRPAGW